MLKTLSFKSSLALAAMIVLAQFFFAFAAHAQDASTDTNASGETHANPARRIVAPLHRPIQGDERMHATTTAPRREISQLHASSTEMHRGPMASTTEHRAEARDGRKSEVAKSLVTKANNQFKMVVGRLTAGIERLTQISSRVDTRIAKLKALNIDMSTAESLNVTAKQKVEDTKAAVKAIQIPTFSTADASTTKDTINASLRTTQASVKAAEDAIRVAQKALLAVVAEISKKGGDKANAEHGDEKPATTSPSSETH